MISELSTKCVRISLSSSLRNEYALFDLKDFVLLAESVISSVSSLGGEVFVVDVRLVGDRRIRTLNRRWRQKDRVTDVLSFPQQETADPSVHFPLEVSREVLLGDIVLCVPQARRQARIKAHSLQEELSWMFVHGLLHLLGYDHQTDAEEKVMAHLEHQALTRTFGGKRSLLD